MTKVCKRIVPVIRNVAPLDLFGVASMSAVLGFGVARGLVGKDIQMQLATPFAAGRLARSTVPLQHSAVVPSRNSPFSPRHWPQVGHCCLLGTFGARSATWLFADGGSTKLPDHRKSPGTLHMKFGFLIEQTTECIVPLSTIPPWKHIGGTTAGDNV